MGWRTWRWLESNELWTWLLEEKERTHRPGMKMDEANQWGFLCTNIDKVPRISWFARPVQTRPFDSWGRSESLAVVSNAPLQDSFYAQAENKQKHVSISIFLFQRCTYLIGPSQFADFNLLGGNKTCHQGLLPFSHGCHVMSSFIARSSDMVPEIFEMAEPSTSKQKT